MTFADRAFQQVFKRLFVYSILFEDTEVDEQFLGIGPESRVLGISGAGCGIANHLSRRPRSIDAVDINASHLAIAALKTTAARDLEYEEFYRLWGYGKHPDPARVASRLTQSLPCWIQRHWRSHHGVFARGFHERGLTARLFAMLRKLSNVDASWLKGLIATPIAERRRAVAERFGPILRSPWVAALLRSPIHLVAIGVNHAQCERMLRTEGLDDIVEFVLMHLGRVAVETDLERNWFAWLAIAGHYNHACREAVPPFLREDRHAQARGAPTQTRFHHANLLDVLAAARPRTWTHYTLLDAPDWMPHAAQRRLLDEIYRTSVDGAVVLHRSVEDTSLPERHGLEHLFKPMDEVTQRATALDRTRQFRRVNFHKVQH